MIPFTWALNYSNARLIFFWHFFLHQSGLSCKNVCLSNCFWTGGVWNMVVSSLWNLQNWHDVPQSRKYPPFSIYVLFAGPNFVTWESNVKQEVLHFEERWTFFFPAQNTWRSLKMAQNSAFERKQLQQIYMRVESTQWECGLECHCCGINNRWSFSISFVTFVFPIDLHHKSECNTPQNTHFQNHSNFTVVELKPCRSTLHWQMQIPCVQVSQFFMELKPTVL